MRIAAGVVTDIGQVREGNEDSFLVEAPLYAVADGMGGHRGGEVASQLALETVETTYREGAPLEDAVRSANRAVFDRSSADEAVAGMGTTITVLVVEPEAAHLVHVGDSRAYLLRAGSLRRLTEDHTLVQRMVTAGKITEAEAEVHPHRSVVLRALGTDAEVALDVQDVGLLEGDRVLLCSDGLTTMITEEQIAAIASATPAPQDAAERLVRAANAAGGIDNITVVVLDVLPDDQDAAGEGAVPEAAPRRSVADAPAAPAPAWRAPAVRVLLALAVVLALFVGGRAWLDNRWYVGVANQHVAIYRGIPEDVLGFQLSSVAQETSLPAEEVMKLPLGYEDLANGLNVDSLQDAQALVSQITADLKAARREARGAGLHAVSVVAPRRRLRGLPLVLVGAAAGIWAYVLQGLGLHGVVPNDAVAYGIAFVAIAAAGWFGIRITARAADPVIYATAIYLGGLGLAMLFRIMDESGDISIARNQAVWFAIGVGAFLALLTVLRDIRQLDSYTYTIGLAGIVLLLLPVVPNLGPLGGYVTNGARLWFKIGPLIFQPAEFGRLFIVIFLASYLAQKREMLAAGVGRFGLPRAKDLGPLLLAWGASLAVLFLERDMGASLLLFAIFVAMVWVATGRPGYLVIGLVLFVAGAGIGYATFDYVQVRVDAWLHALDPALVQNAGYQLAQGWFAFASGGMVGTGLGLGSPTLIPFPGSDFILAAFGEELGMLGVSALLLGYLVLIGRGLRIGLERRDPFESLLAVGLTALLGLQVFVIAGGVLRLIPLTGVPLPLVAYGGSSKIATFLALGLLVRISAGPWLRAPKELT